MNYVSTFYIDDKTYDNEIFILRFHRIRKIKNFRRKGKVGKSSGKKEAEKQRVDVTKGDTKKCEVNGKMRWIYEGRE